VRAIVASAVLVAVVVALFPALAARASDPAPVSVNESITLTVGPAQGSDAVTIEGKGPALAPIVLVLHATYSRDLPTVYINQYEVTADADGNFKTVVPVAPDYWRGSILTVTASSSATVSSATAQTIVNLPNPGVVLPADDVPNH
jgi:hypothetical protein